MTSTTQKSGWVETTLGEVLNIFTGKKDVNQTVETGKYPFFSCSPEVFRSDEFIVDDEALIITGNGSYTGTVRYFSGKCDLYQRTYACTPRKEKVNAINMKFIFYYAKKFFEKNFMGGTRGSSIPYIVRGDIENFIIPLPPLSEQRAIAAVLSSLDEKIELLREQNKTLEAMAQELFREWFTEFNFPDADGKPYKKSGGKMIDSELGEIPEGWRVGKLSDEFEIVMGQSPSGESYNEIGEGVIFFQGRAEFQERFPKTRLYTTEPKRMAEKFDVLVSVRAPVGDINVAFERCCIGRGLAAVGSEYKSYLLYKIKSLSEIFEKFESEGTVFGSINKDSFANISVTIPSDEHIKRFEDMTHSMDQKYFNNHSQIEVFSTLRDELLPGLMSAKLRVEHSNFLQ